MAYAVATEWLSLHEVAEELGIDYKRVREWIRLKSDPLPARLFPGNKKQARVYRHDLNEWLMRNSEPFQQ